MMSHFQASHRQLFVCAGGFFPHVKTQMDLYALSRTHERRIKTRRGLFVIIVADLLISEPVAKHQFKC